MLIQLVHFCDPPFRPSVRPPPQAAELIFFISTFYICMAVIFEIKQQGCGGYFDSKNFWNWMEVFTCVMSIAAIILYVIRFVVVQELNEEINRTEGNEYIRSAGGWGEERLVRNFLITSASTSTSSLFFPPD